MKYRKLVIMLLTMTAVLFGAGCSQETSNLPVSGTPTVAATEAPTATVEPTATSTPTPTLSPTPTPTPGPSASELFDEYTEQLFLNEIALNTINLHYTLAYPENFGITEYEPSLGSFDLEKMKQSVGEMKVLKEDLEAIAEVLRDTNIIVLSDEIYGELRYDDEGHTPFSAIDGMRERTVIVNGFSKTFAMTGWRLGYALGPTEIIKAMTKLHQYGIMSSPTTSQFAAIEALRSCDKDVENMRNEYNYRRRFIVDGFRNMGLSCFEPLGAFYVFPCIKSLGMTSEEFANKLLMEEKVAVVPGNAFGESGEGFIRCSYAYSIESIDEALKRIGRFVEKYRK